MKGVKVHIYESLLDGRIVVDVLTSDETPSDENGVPDIRVWVNDGVVFGKGL